MAMNKTTLAAAIVTKLKARNAGITGASETQLTEFWEDIAGEIIAHIKANAVVTIAGLTGSGTVNSGAGAGGAVTVTSSGANGTVSA